MKDNDYINRYSPDQVAGGFPYIGIYQQEIQVQHTLKPKFLPNLHFKY